MSADTTPLAVPRIDRRRPEPPQDGVRLDPEGARAAIDLWRQLRDAVRDGLPGASEENAIILCVIAYVRTLREAERRGSRFPLSNGTTVEGVHPQDVKEAEAVIQRWGGLVIEGLRGEETVARALGAAFASRDRRLAEGRQHHRRRDPVVARMVDEVAHRLRVHRATFSSSQR